MKCIYRIIWQMWFVGTFLWAAAVWIYVDNKPTVADILLLSPLGSLR